MRSAQIAVAAHRAAGAKTPLGSYAARISASRVRWAGVHAFATRAAGGPSTPPAKFISAPPVAHGAIAPTTVSKRSGHRVGDGRHQHPDGEQGERGVAARDGVGGLGRHTERAAHGPDLGERDRQRAGGTRDGEQGVEGGVRQLRSSAERSMPGIGSVGSAWIEPRAG
ncbi:hypothetical protein ACYAFX_23880 [Rhodococcus aetherivorans]